MKLKYSDVLKGFYRIGLSEETALQIDIHWTAMAMHHLLLFRCESPNTSEFHQTRHRAHFRAMLDLIWRNGDFSGGARDESLKGLEHRDSWGWKPEMEFTMIDPDMFRSIALDQTLSIGQPHPSDRYLGPLVLSPSLLNRRLAS